MKKITLASTLVLTLLLTFMLTQPTLSSANASNNGDYFLKTIKVNETSALLKKSKVNLNKSYIVIADSGIDKTFYSSTEGKTVSYNTAFAGQYPINHKGSKYYIHDVYDDYYQGTAVISISDQIIRALKVNKLNSKSENQSLLVLPIKTTSSKGTSNAKICIDTINDVIDYYVLKNNLPISVINISSGLTWNNNGPTAQEERKKLQNAINRANSFGISIVAPSGDKDAKISTYPALMGNVIVVGATNAKNERLNKNKLNSSCYGKELDLVAPGSDVTIANNQMPFKPGSYYNALGDGTSYSAPMVSTAIALIKSINPKLTPIQIKTILKNSATDLGPKGRDDYYGSGLLNMEATIKNVLNSKQ